MATSLKTTLKNPFLWWSAFGASAVVGATAAVLWAPASGSEVRTRLATGLGGWWQALRSRANARRPGRAGVGPRRSAARGGPNLAMQPNRLLTED